MDTNPAILLSPLIRVCWWLQARSPFAHRSKDADVTSGSRHAPPWMKTSHFPGRDPSRRFGGGLAEPAEGIQTVSVCSGFFPPGTYGTSRFSQPTTAGLSVLCSGRGGVGVHGTELKAVSMLTVGCRSRTSRRKLGCGNEEVRLYEGSGKVIEIARAERERERAREEAVRRGGWRWIKSARLDPCLREPEG